MIKVLMVLISVSGLFCLFACDDGAPKKKKAPTVRVVAKKVIAPTTSKMVVPEVVEKPMFRYKTNGRRDPFTSLFAVREPLQSEAEPMTPLQKFGVKELRLTAIVSGKGETRAMVIAPDKKAYVLTVGIKVGRNQGYVKMITVDEVVVEERFRDFSGGIRTEVKKITLPHGERK